MTDPKTEARLPRYLVTILRTEAKNQRTPPIDYVIAEDGGRMVHRPDPDIAMAELLEEAASLIQSQAARIAVRDELIAAFVQANDEGPGLIDCIDNHGDRYTSASLDATIRSARSLLNGERKG